jgi:hypothetical protein
MTDLANFASSADFYDLPRTTENETALRAVGFGGGGGTAPDELGFIFGS